MLYVKVLMDVNAQIPDLSFMREIDSRSLTIPAMMHMLHVLMDVNCVPPASPLLTNLWSQVGRREDVYMW